ncbi:sigma-70 family RNA polymerase sigma factor [Aeromicrobium sp. IC_218]|uniref:RNA polymerase sigma factor n=1 Tax=Aeromicrobium sp. IC_218 TaxID=2545468 RepID=UPI00103FC7AC|nr:sigma-70 family RNA polymerase sigma factor [Aeromicrobium sp. IC_218]TCI98707.1 sigma-70 family RNA polymerase sigma factor [Aeromicrobium sp. IC_218]
MIPDPVADDHALVSRARSGDREAFGELYARHVRPVYWQAYGVVGSAADAEEVVQEVFVVAWRRLADLHLVDASALPWLLVTAKNIGRNHARRASRRRWEAYDETAASDDAPPDEQVATALVLERVRESLAGLSDVDRRLFELCVLGDLTYAQAADELGLTHGGIRNRVSRLRGRLRRDTDDLRGLA